MHWGYCFYRFLLPSQEKQGEDPAFNFSHVPIWKEQLTENHLPTIQKLIWRGFLFFLDNGFKFMMYSCANTSDPWTFRSSFEILNELLLTSFPWKRSELAWDRSEHSQSRYQKLTLMTHWDVPVPPTCLESCQTSFLTLQYQEETQPPNPDSLPMLRCSTP